MFEYLKLETKGVVSEETLRDFVDSSVTTLDWLQSKGVPFEGSLCPYKTSYPTDDYYLYYSGNEGFSPFKDAAKPAPRGHRAKGEGLPGASFYEPLRRTAERVILVIADNGSGISADVQGGMGLRNMRERIEALPRGRFEFDSTPGQGTRVTLSFNIEES